MGLRIIGRAWVLGSCLLLSGACSSKTTSSPGDGGSRPASAAELPQAFAAGVCKAFARCCGSQDFAFDLAECERSIEADLEGEVREHDGQAVDFDPDAAAKCIADYASAVCPTAPGPSYDVKRNCRFMFVGRLAEGEACTSSDECHQTAEVDADCGAEGVCVAYPVTPHPKRGQACGGTCRNTSGDEYACDAVSAAAGDPPADESLPLCYTLDGLQCSTDSGTAKTCQPLVALGQSCEGNSQACAAGATCDLDTRLCVEKAVGGPCETSSSCPDSAVCDPNQTCVEVGLPNGARCASAEDCRSQYCNPSSVCQPSFTADECSAPIRL